MKDIIRKKFKIIIFFLFIIFLIFLLKNNVYAIEEQVNQLYLTNLKIIAITDSEEKVLEPIQEYNEQSLEREYYGIENIKDIKIEYKTSDKSILVEVKKPEEYSNETNILEIKVVRNEEFIIYHLFINNTIKKTEENIQNNENEENDNINQNEIIEDNNDNNENKENKFVIGFNHFIGKLVEILNNIKLFIGKYWIIIISSIIILSIIIIIKNKIQEKKASKARQELKDRCR